MNFAVESLFSLKVESTKENGGKLREKARIKIHIQIQSQNKHKKWLHPLIPNLALSYSSPCPLALC
jgi:hypothetical protein